jgi:putative FmdB family regulatory protein
MHRLILAISVSIEKKAVAIWLTRNHRIFIIFKINLILLFCPGDDAMPIYEFYCKDCRTIFNFFSKTVNTRKVPLCPKCHTTPLTRQVSLFAFTGRAKEAEDIEDLPFDESKMEQAMNMLAGEAENISEDDPRQAASLMRKLSNMSGLKLGHGMEEALSRMEKGEDPDSIEAELGDILENEDPFVMAGKKKKGREYAPAGPFRDETLYDL